MLLTVAKGRARVGRGGRALQGLELNGKWYEIVLRMQNKCLKLAGILLQTTQCSLEKGKAVWKNGTYTGKMRSR